MGNYKLPGFGLGNATPDKVLEGSTFTSNNGVKQAGTMQDISEKVTAQKSLVKEILVSLRIPETPPTGTNKQILQTNNVNLKKVKDKFYRLPVSLEITPPAKVLYEPNEPINLTGMVVKCTFDNGVVEDVTRLCTVSPMKFETEGTHTVTVSYDEQIVITGTFEATAMIFTTWTTGTDEQIVAMVKAADEGKINLADYWTVGDIRTVHLSKIKTSTGSVTQEQDVEFVLMQEGLYDLTIPTPSGRTKCSFIVGMKGFWEIDRKSLGSSGAIGWGGDVSKILHQDFRNALPETLLPIFKSFKKITRISMNSNELHTNNVLFSLAAKKEVVGGGVSDCESNALKQFEWYKTASNLIKKDSLTGVAKDWWTCTIKDGYGNFWFIDSKGSLFFEKANFQYEWSPYGCI